MMNTFWRFLLCFLLVNISHSVSAGTCGNTVTMAITIGSKGVVMREPDKPVTDEALGVIYANELYFLRENGREVQRGVANKHGQVIYPFVIGQMYQLDNVIQPMTFMIADAGCKPQLTQIK
ncbi:hypothetical protein FHU10_0581 [Serratia fonticola]|jgi:hypothetical protein|uniref:Uncharacterized protein n=1 Tax=Serratia fonticola TaxID=47917 RepID=A0A542BL72_SERFO|nr:hypothetical protein [Serratia fonticola]TQI79344.1 hypothetical protein FHU09_1869 [Serratia fonticola]TQI98631.1 hypothetical protein FHU11_4179 [Serratia fonticola]TVZ68159.1 hypothetical protein FHU10_0581 [Serratia fonticola]